MTDETTGPVPPPVSDDPKALLRHMRSPAALRQSQEAEARRSDYRQAYWKTYSHRMKRVTMTIPRDVHAMIVALADANGRKASPSRSTISPLTSQPDAVT